MQGRLGCGPDLNAQQNQVARNPACRRRGSLKSCLRQERNGRGKPASIANPVPWPCSPGRDRIMPGRAPSAPRCAAIVGPYSSGKTSLLESLLHVTGALSKKGTAKEKTLLGDSSAEARARGLSVEATAAQAEFLGETLDLPGLPRRGRAVAGHAQRGAGSRRRHRGGRAADRQGPDPGADLQVSRRQQDSPHPLRQQDGPCPACACAT